MVIDLAQLAAGSDGFVIHGEEAGDNSGFSVSAAGDFNNDGFDDLVIGAFLADGGAGASYVVFGHADGFGTVDLANVAAGNGGFVIHGEEAGDNSGVSVSSVGDINGDGFDDIVIGAWQADGPENEPRTLAGASYVVFGRGFGPDGPFPAVDLAAVAAGTGGFVIHGEDVNDQSGFTAVSAGDINGDTFIDLAIGVLAGNGDNNTLAHAGDTYVVFGHAGPFGPVDLADVAAGTVDGFVIHGEDAGDTLGISVSLAGDINGDDIDDLVIGARRANGAGNASPDAGDTYVVFGHTGAFPDIVAGNGGFVIHGEDPNDHFGVAVSSAGDFNGDGVDDFVIGAELADGPGNTRADAGATYVVFGQRGAFEAVNLAAIAAGNGDFGFVIHGAVAEDASGLSVSFAGDVNGDTFDDLIIGAAFADGADNTRTNAGDTYVLFGHARPFPAVDLADIADGSGFVIHGQDDEDRFGISVSAAGDINRDSFDDLIIGAALADGPGNTRLSAGDSYVLFGSATIGADVPDAPTVDAGADRTADEGETVTLTATFADRDVGDTHTATIDWGDGTIVDAIVAAGQVSDGHAYADNGAYTVTVTVTDDTGLFGTDSLIAIVNNVAPLANDLSLSVPLEGGAPQTFGFSATDAGFADTLSFTILTLPTEGAVTNNADGTFTFDPEADFEDLRAGETRAVSFTYRASDDDGADSTPATVTITVAGANPEAPTVNAGADRTADEAQVIALTATFTDPDAADTHTATIDWGDGTVLPATVAAGEVSGSHAYADNGTYTVTVTVTDGTGLVGTDSLVTTINNVAPVAQNLTYSGPVENGPPQTFAFSATDLASADLLAFTILSSPSAGTVANNANGTFTFDPGSAFEDLRQGETRAVSFTYRAADDDGANSAPASVTINVAGVGDKTQTLNDPLNAQPWSTQVSVYDNADRLVSHTVNYDDGTKSVTFHDAAGAQSWSSKFCTYDATGRLVSETFNNDGGSITATGFDTLNQYDWFDFVAGYGSQQSKTFEDTHYDDGRLVTYKQDVLDQHDWTQNTNVYDNLGRKMSEEQTRDDGSHMVWKFDTLDQYDWSTDYTSYDNEWNKLSESKTLDDGTTTSWSPSPPPFGGGDFGPAKTFASIAFGNSDFDLLR